MSKRGRKRGGWIEELPSGKFRAGFSNGSKVVDGKTIQVKVQATFDKYGQASLWLNEKLEEKDKGKLVVDSGISMSQWIKDWLDSLKYHAARNSILIYERCCEKYLIPELGDCRMNQLDAVLIEQAIGRLAEKGVSRPDLNKSVKVLRQSLKDAVRLKKLYANPADQVRLPKVPKKEMLCWTKEQARAFLACVRYHRLYPLWLLALDTGMRQGEILALRWGDINLQEGYLDVKHTLEDAGGVFRLKEPKTGKSRRRIWIGKPVVEALRDMKDRPGMMSKGSDVAKVFKTRTRNWLNRDNLCVWLKRAIELAGLPKIRFHDLRHTNATLLLAAGVGIKTVSERLGHANVRITMDTYAHVLPGEQQAVAKTSGGIFSPQSHELPTEEDKEKEVHLNGFGASQTGYVGYTG